MPSSPSFMFVFFPYQGRTSENILDLSFDILTSSAMARNSRGKGKKAVVESEEEEEYTVEKILDRRSVLTCWSKFMNCHHLNVSNYYSLEREKIKLNTS